MTGLAQAQGWRGILPLHSTRADVERLLGPPAESCKDGCDYDTKNEGVFVRYSIGRCADGGPNAWNVPPNTVLSLSINLAKRPRLSELRLNLRRCKKTADPELHGYSSYENEDEGDSYAVSDDGRVYSINRFATTKDDRALRCQAESANLARSGEGHGSIKFDKTSPVVFVKGVIRETIVDFGFGRTIIFAVCQSLLTLGCPPVDLATSMFRTSRTC